MVITPCGVRHCQVSTVQTIWPAFICTRHTEAIFEFADWNHVRAFSSKRNCGCSCCSSTCVIRGESDDLTSQIRRIVRMIRYEHTVNRVVNRKIILRISQQPDSSITGVTHSDRRRERHLSFKTEVPLLRIRHFQSWIDQRHCVSCCLWARHKNKSIRWVSEIDGIEPCASNCLVQEKRIRWIESNCCAPLREYRLKDTAVIGSVAPADGRIAHTAKHLLQKVIFKFRTPGEPKTRLPIVLVSLNAIVDPTSRLFRSGHILVAQSQIERQVGTDLPVVFRVEVRLVDAI